MGAPDFVRGPAERGNVAARLVRTVASFYRWTRALPSPEISDDQRYLNQVRAEFESAGTPAESVLAYGEPADEIIKWIREKGCDLVAMSTHGHRFLADLFLGTTASRVQHQVKVPVLLLRAR